MKRSPIHPVPLLLTVILVLAACAAGPPRGPARAESGSARSPVETSAAMDADRNKLFDALERRLEQAGEHEPVPVIITLDRVRPAHDLERFTGPLPGVRAFGAVPAVAALATSRQIHALADLPFVVQIEPDAPIHADLAGASHWFGTAKARTDFGVSGSWDGYPDRYSSGDIVIAVIDSGIDTGHGDLPPGKVIAWQDFVHDRPGPYDDNGHGTHVASIAAGTGAGDPNYTGVAPGAALIGLKVMDEKGDGQESWAIAAVDWAISHRTQYNIRVANLSLGAGDRADGTDALSRAVNRAVDAGIVVVVSAGNTGPAAGTIGSPAAAVKAVTVGALADPDRDGFFPAAFSSRGPGPVFSVKPDLLAPGVRIMAAAAGTGAEYVAHDGTSMAAPFVAGTVALMLDANRDLKPARVAEILHQTAEDWGPPGPDPDSGYGRLDGYAAVRAAGALKGTGPEVPMHRYLAGEIAAAGTEAEHLIAVTSTQYPIAVTLLMPDWSGPASPDFDLYLYGPDGALLGWSEGALRQEVVSGTPVRPGTYRVVVRSKAGAGRYQLDLSGQFEPADAEAAAEKVMTGRLEPGNDDAWQFVRARSPGWLDLSLSWPGGADLDFSVYGPEQSMVALRAGTANPEAVRLDAGLLGTGVYWIKLHHDSGDPADYTLRAAFTAARTGSYTLEPGQHEQRIPWPVNRTGTGRFRLGWTGPADLDFLLYDPGGRLRARGFTFQQPEQADVEYDQTGDWLIVILGDVTERTPITLEGWQPADGLT